MPSPNPKLNPGQVDALGLLADDPEAHVEPAILSKLRKLGLAGKVVTRAKGHQKTTSPVTEAGQIELARRGFVGKPKRGEAPPGGPHKLSCAAWKGWGCDCADGNTEG